MFKVYKKQIPEDIIDSIVMEHSNFKKSPYSIFRAQGTTRFEAPILNSNNNQINSIQNPHLLGFNKHFSFNIERAILSNNVSSCLSDFTGVEKHVWYQSMFFDNSTGTKLHQDSWYLDTVPNGKLVGVWIALEEIKISSGPFCIYSNTDAVRMSTDEFNFNDLEADPKFKTKFPNAKRYDFLAEKGDILIWDSFAIHGALMPEDSTKTRKSITAHFYPLGSNIQDPPVERFFSIYNHINPVETVNSRILKSTTISPIFYQALCITLYFMGRVKFIKNLLLKESEDKSLTEIRRL